MLLSTDKTYKDVEAEVGGILQTEDFSKIFYF